MIMRVLLVLLAGCWVTPGEVDDKINELETDDTASDTSDTGLSGEG